MRDCHDKRLRFSVFSCDYFSLDLLFFCFSQLFLVKMAVFCISEKYQLDDRNFEKLKLVDPPFKHFFDVKAFSL